MELNGLSMQVGVFSSFMHDCLEQVSQGMTEMNIMPRVPLAALFNRDNAVLPPDHIATCKKLGNSDWSCVGARTLLNSRCMSPGVEEIHLKFNHVDRQVANGVYAAGLRLMVSVGSNRCPGLGVEFYLLSGFSSPICVVDRCGTLALKWKRNPSCNEWLI